MIRGRERVLVDLAPLRSTPAFRRLWIGQACSGFGSQLTLVAVLFQVWQLTGSTIWTGAVGAAQAIPLIVLGPFAGSLIDRADRRHIYLGGAIGQAAFSILLAAQALWGRSPALGVLLVVAGQACFSAAGGPAARTFIPQLLPADQVAAGLALNRTTFQLSMLTGPAAGGVLIGWLGVQGCYLADAITFTAAVYGALGLPALPPQGQPARSGLPGMADGLSFLFRTPVLRAALLTDLAATVLSFPISLFPLINAERFDDDPRTLGLFLTSLAVGGALAAVFGGTFTRLPRPGLVLLTGSTLWGTALALFGAVPNRWVGVALLAVAGVADTVSVVARGTIVALNTPDELRGRIAAAEQIVGQAGPDLGNLRGGVIASASSGVIALVSGGVLCVAAVALIGATTPGLRRYTFESPAA